MVAFRMAKVEPLESDNLKKEVGRRMRARREMLRMRQEDVAMALFMNRVTYNQWETGRNEMALTDLPRIAKVLRTTVSFLLFGEHDELRDESGVVAYLNDLPDELRDGFESAIKAAHERVMRSQTTHGKKAE